MSSFRKSLVAARAALPASVAATLAMLRVICDIALAVTAAGSDSSFFNSRSCALMEFTNAFSAFSAATFVARCRALGSSAAAASDATSVPTSVNSSRMIGISSSAAMSSDFSNNSFSALDASRSTATPTDESISSANSVRKVLKKVRIAAAFALAGIPSRTLVASTNSATILSSRALSAASVASVVSVFVPEAVPFLTPVSIAEIC